MTDTAKNHVREQADGPRLLCLVNRHEPAGRGAAWNGDTYISRCEHCDKPIYRVRKGKWKRDRRKSRQD